MKRERKNMTTKYECVGSVCGSCGHKHNTVEAAVKCLVKDQKRCKSQGGYSDRKIKGTDGSLWVGDITCGQVNSYRKDA